MRNKQQLALRLERVALANELLAWLDRKKLYQGKDAWQLIIDPFVAETNYPGYEVWLAWGILHEAGRRRTSEGSNWSVKSVEPVVVNLYGDVVAPGM